MEDIGIKTAAKLGILLAIGWALIFAGCLSNIHNQLRAFILAAILFIAIIVIALTSPFWVHGMIGKKNVNALGGGEELTDECDNECEICPIHCEDCTCKECEKRNEDHENNA
jgi:hypothetical protein